MDEIAGEVIRSLDGDRPFRAVITRRGRVMTFCDARTLAEAERFLTQQLRNASMAGKRCGRVARTD